MDGIRTRRLSGLLKLVCLQAAIVEIQSWPYESLLNGDTETKKNFKTLQRIQPFQWATLGSVSAPGYNFPGLLCISISTIGGSKGVNVL